MDAQIIRSSAVYKRPSPKNILNYRQVCGKHFCGKYFFGKYSCGKYSWRDQNPASRHRVANKKQWSRKQETMLLILQEVYSQLEKRLRCVSQVEADDEFG